MPTPTARPATRASYHARKEHLARTRPFVIAGIALIGCLFVFLCVVALDGALNANKIHYGVRADVYKVGGMTVDEATVYLEKQLAQISKKPLKVTYQSEQWSIAASDISLKFKAGEMAQNAYNIGRDGNVVHNVLTRLKAYGSKPTVTAVYTVNADKAAKVFKRLQKKTDKEPVDSSVKLKDGAFVVTEGSDGAALNTNDLVYELVEAFISHETSVKAPVDTLPMGVSREEAQRAADLAQKLSERGVTVTHGKKSWKLSAADTKKLFAFKRNQDIDKDDAYVNEGTLKSQDKLFLTPYISQKKVASVIIAPMGQEVGHAAVDAKFSTSGGHVSIIPSKNGEGADPSALASDIVAALQNADEKPVVAVKTATVEPEITTEKARKMGIKERIGTYTTTYSSGNGPRVNNIHLLAKSLDNTLIAPGKTFSFNGTVGERTAEKGYKEAGAIVDGELVNQLGGGICQVNTTLFNAVLYSGLPIEQRVNHSEYISHYPLARDATVSWGGPDFKFTNNTSTWVLISSSYTNSSVTISIYGTDQGLDVKLSDSKWIKKTDYKTKEVKDPDLKAGTRVTESSGVQGGVAVFTRTIKKDGKVVRETTFKSNYIPKAQVVRVGTKGADTKDSKSKSGSSDAKKASQ